MRPGWTDCWCQDSETKLRSTKASRATGQLLTETLIGLGETQSIIVPCVLFTFGGQAKDWLALLINQSSCRAALTSAPLPMAPHGP